VSGLLVLSVDQQLAGHLAVAIRRHRTALAELGRPCPPGLSELEDLAARVGRNEQERAGTSRNEQA
jgi:hypothetical protein